MVLVQKFRIFNEDTGQSSPWHKVKFIVLNVEALKAVREQLGVRVFVRPADIDLCFVEVSENALHRRISRNGKEYNYGQQITKTHKIPVIL